MTSHKDIRVLRVSCNHSDQGFRVHLTEREWDSLVESQNEMEAEIARLNKINTEMDREHRAWHRMMEAEIERLKRCNAAMDTEHRAWHRMADKAIALEAERDMALAKVKSMEIALSAAKENLSRKQDELNQSRK